VKKKCAENQMSKSKSQIPSKSRKSESPINIATNMEEEVDSNEVIAFNMLFSKFLVKIQVPKQLRQLLVMELYDG